MRSADHTAVGEFGRVHLPGVIAGRRRGPLALAAVNPCLWDGAKRDPLDVPHGSV